MGLLGEIYSSGDRMKRKLRGLLDDPMGTIALGSQRMSEDVQQMGLLADESGYLPGTNSVLLTPQQKERARKALADKGAEMALAAATVWHGSPHKFDKFDSSKIGTGEGAQAYGHGLYLAESDTVARHYKNAGADPSKFVPVRSIRDPAQMAATVLDRAGGDMKHATAVLTQNMQSGDITAGAALQLLKQRAALPESKYAGHMYKVDLPDDQIAKMLDWDKPLSQQPKVLAAMKGTALESFLPYADNMTGGQLISQLGNNRAASDQIRKLGAPGIRYLDGGSRGAGQGSSNFVVFPGNEGLLSILERNGAPIGK